MSHFNYSLLKPGKFIDQLAYKKRKLMYQIFMEALSPVKTDTILDAGVTADCEALSSNFLEQLYPFKENILALSNQDAHFLEQKYPGLQFKNGDVRALPFASQSLDYVFSSAVIEHVGLEHQQLAMIEECYRVARKGVFITTPNRWHPIEAHTILPLIHWLPKSWHRRLLKQLGFEFYADPDNLNLLDQKLLVHFCKKLNIRNYKIIKMKTFGFTSNLMLIIERS